VIIDPTLPSGHTLFCDDIRQEVGGKVSYIGIYAGVMFVNEIPAQLSKLCLAITYRDSIEANGTVTIRVIYEVDGEDQILTEADCELQGELALPTNDEFRMLEMRLFIQIAPFQITNEGKLKVRVFKGEDKIRIGALEVKRAPNNQPV